MSIFSKVSFMFLFSSSSSLDIELLLTLQESKDGMVGICVEYRSGTIYVSRWNPFILVREPSYLTNLADLIRISAQTW